MYEPSYEEAKCEAACKLMNAHLERVGSKMYAQPWSEGNGWHALIGNDDGAVRLPPEVAEKALAELGDNAGEQAAWEKLNETARAFRAASLLPNSGRA